MNPWSEIPEESPYVLKSDKKYVEVFNEQLSEDDQRRINLKHLPEPRLGRIDAPIVILQSNPSFQIREADGSIEQDDRHEAWCTLHDEYWPHKGAREDTEWWGPRLRELRSEVGEKVLANNLLSVEFFPYRSRNFAHGEIRLPSQQYTFSLVQSAIDRNAVIIVARNWSLWCSALPDLYSRHGENVFTVSNPRSSYYSRNNIEKNGYSVALDALRRQRHDK